MNTPAKSEVSSLVSLIADAVSSVESYYKANGGSIPSLDNIQPHPVDDLPYPADIRRAVQTIEGACRQLCATVVRPSLTLFNGFMTSQYPTSLGVALHFKVADVLLDEPTGMPVYEISKRSGIEQGKLRRVLRLLCSHHIFKEVSEDTFANNRLSMQLLTSNPSSSYGYFHTVEPIPQILSVLTDTLRDPNSGHSYAAADSAFSRATGYKDSMYAYFEGKNTEIGAIHGARFARGMAGLGTVTEVDSVITDFPWADLPNGTVVNDVGGGIGGVAMKLCKQHPNLVLKLQDLPERIAQAQNEIWPTSCPEAIADERIEFQAFDMIHEPPIPNCDIYFLKNIIHCFSNDTSITIFKNIAKAMTPTSRLLMQEWIIQGTYRVPDHESEHKQAPVPLLPNFGCGRMFLYNIDMTMMEAFNSEERTLDGYTKLAEAAGLQFVKFWDVGQMSVVEFALAE